MPIQPRRCRKCKRVYEILVHGGVETSLSPDRKDPDDEEFVHGRDLSVYDTSCESCGSTDYEPLVARATGLNLGGDAGVGRKYPYFDRALGVMVSSATHRRQLMTHHADGRPRAEVLVPTDGDFDPLADARADARQAEEDERVYNEEMDRRRHGPDRAAYAKLERMIADGWMPPSLEEG